jgi:hypothetical protein
MRRSLIGSGVLGALLVGAIVAYTTDGGAQPGAAQDAAETPEATATRAAEEAELADLRTQVAELSTEVARLSGAGEAVLGRLGGARGGFAEEYGEPVTFVGPDQAIYDVSDVGRLTATFADGLAKQLVVVPPRPPDKPIDEADSADWTLDQAREIARRFAPADATFDEELPGDVSGVVEAGSSEALATALGPAADEAAACPPAAGSGAFTITFTQPTAETVSAITLAAAAAPSELPTTEVTPADQGRTGRGGGAVANSSLGGTVTVNGIRAQAHGARSDVEGTRAPAADHRFYAVEATIANQTDRPLAYDLVDFVLVDDQGRELTAICGGAEPAITRGELAPGDEVEGWITFQVPVDFTPTRFVYLVDSAKIGFNLR